MDEYPYSNKMALRTTINKSYETYRLDAMVQLSCFISWHQRRFHTYVFCF